MIRSRSMVINLPGGDGLRSYIPFTSSGGSPTPQSSIGGDSFFRATALRVLGTSTNARRLVIILFVIALYLCGVLLLTPHPRDEHRSSLQTSRELTVVINTFKRPPGVVEDAIDFYAQCEVVKHIFIIWSDSSKAPPQKLTNKFSNWKSPSVTFQLMSTASLNNRFKPLQGPHTAGIFAVDDDMRVPCEDIALGFEVWQASSLSLVGFMPRIHIQSKSGLVYRCWWRVWWHGVYSIILTKAAFLHHDFFEMYTNVMPQGIRSLVDRMRNCEDLAMQFLMANVTGLPPIYVKGHLQDLGVLNGISTSKNVASARHMDGRSKCLNELTGFYGKVPLVISHVVVDTAANSWTNRPSTWFEYISSDLWKM